MKKFKVSPREMKSIKGYMDHFVDQGIVSSEQAGRMVDTFEAHSLNFVTVVTAVGAVLIGLGILSYIASNWDHFTAAVKVAVILVSMVAFYVAGLKLEDKYVRPGKSLQYISIFIYGGGLFLVDQTFNLNLAVSEHFALWILGILPIVWLHRDYLIYVFAQLLTGAYILMLMERTGDLDFALTFGLAVLLTAIWIFLDEKQYRAELSLFLNNAYPILLLIVLFVYFDWNILAFTGIMLAYGAFMLYRPMQGRFAPVLNRVEGILVMGIAGFMLSFEDLWEEWPGVSDGTVFAIVFSIVFVGCLFWLTRQGSMTSLIFILAFILKFYFDTLYDFMPKSVFFLIGGCILLAFGFYMERMARKKGVIGDAETKR